MRKDSRKPEFGPRIAAFRKQQGLSQGIISQRTGIDPSYLSRLEKGRVHPTVRTAMRIAEALRVSLDEILGPSPPERRNKSCPVSISGSCLLDLLDTAPVSGNESSDREKYTPRQLRLLRRFTHLIHGSPPELFKALEVLIQEITAGKGARKKSARSSTKK